MSITPTAKPNPLKDAANAIADAVDADVLFLNGELDRHSDDRLIELVTKRKRRTNAVFVLVTPGGDADAAYRIARCLQDNYTRFTVIVPGWCKSAGTMCVLGAHELVMTDCAELGPLDVQIYKKDELGEMSSGLVLKEALHSMSENAFEMFEEYMLRIKTNSAGLITFKTATDIAAKLAVGLFEPVYRQIDPAQIGELERSMSIARAYGERLRIKGRNFDSDALTSLVGAYPSHGFVIDRREAEELFEQVREPSELEGILIAALGERGKFPVVKETATLAFLSDELTEVKGEQNDTEGGPEAGVPGAGSQSNAANSGDREAAEDQAASGTDGAPVKLIK